MGGPPVLCIKQFSPYPDQEKPLAKLEFIPSTLRVSQFPLFTYIVWLRISVCPLPQFLPRTCSWDNYVILHLRLTLRSAGKAKLEQSVLHQYQ